MPKTKRQKTVMRLGVVQCKDTTQGWLASMFGYQVERNMFEAKVLFSQELGP